MAKNKYEINLSNKNNHEATKRKKKKKHVRKNKFFTDTLNTESENKKLNNSYKRVFLHDTQVPPYVCNNLAYGKVDNSPTCTSNSCRKINTKGHENHTFTASLISNGVTSEKSSYNRKRKNSDNNVYINKKSKGNNTIDRLQRSNKQTSNFENDLENDTPIANDVKEDSELFFFDISGNRSNSFASALATFSDVPLIGKQRRQAPFQISSRKNGVNGSVATPKKSRKNSHVKAITDMRNDEDEAISLENGLHQVKNYDGRPFINKIVDVGDHKRKKKRNSFQLDSSLITNRTDNEDILNQEENTGVEDTSSTFNKPKKSKKHKVNTTVDIRDSECEMSVSDVLIPKKKMTKRIPIELNVSEKPNTGMSNLPKKSKTHKEVKALVDIRDSDCEMSFSDVSVHKKNSRESIPSKKLMKLKKKHTIETLVDIGDRDCEMSITDGSLHKKKEKKKIAIVDDADQEKITLNEKNVEGDIEHDNVRKLNEEQSNFKPPKKLKKKCPEMLVDIRESDCEMSVTDVTFHKKKKKKKIPIDDAVPDQEEITLKKRNGNNFNNVVDHDVGKINEQYNFKPPKKLKKKQSEMLVDSRESDCEMNYTDVTFAKGKKKKRISIEDEESTPEIKNGEDFNDNVENDDVQETNVESNGFKSPKKSKKKARKKDSKMLVDIRDSDCEMSVSGVSVHKKKKKKKHIENQVKDAENTPKMKKGDYLIDDIENDNIEETNGEPNGFKSPKKSKKKHSKMLVDIRDSDCEMSVSGISEGVSSNKKKKKKKLSIENEVPDAESTPKMKNGVNFNDDIQNENVQESNEEPNSIKSSKEFKKKSSEMLVDSRDSDCGMSFSAVSIHKKKKKKKIPIENVVLDAESAPKLKRFDNLVGDIENENIQEREDEPNSIKLPNKFNKKHSEMLVDIRDSDCEMSVSRKKRKKKKVSIENEVPDAESTPKMKNVVNFKDDIKNAIVQKTTENPNGFKSLKKSKKKHSKILVDIRDSDCEMSVSGISEGVSSNKKKKKKKLSIENEVPFAESTPKIKNGVNFNGDIQNDNVQDLNEESNSIKSSKEFKKKSSDCEMSFSAVSIHKKKKNKKTLEEDEIPGADRIPKVKNKDDFNAEHDVLRNEEVNSIKSPKKSKKRHTANLAYIKEKKKFISVEEKLSEDKKNVSKMKNEEVCNNDVEYDISNSINLLKNLKKNPSENLVDIRDSDCEMSISDVSFHKKNNKKRVCKEHQLADEKESVPKIKNQEDFDIISNNNKSPKKLIKKHSEILEDSKDSEYEMSCSNVMPRKKKKKKVAIKGDQEENTLKNKNIEVFNTDVDYDKEKNNLEDNRTGVGKTKYLSVDIDSDLSPQNNSKKKYGNHEGDLNALLGILDHETSFSGVSNKKKNKDRYLGTETTANKKYKGTDNVDCINGKETSQENETAISNNTEETKKKKNKYNISHDDIFKKVGSSESKTPPGVKSKNVEVDLNSSNFENNLISINQIGAFRENGLIKNSLENSDKHKQDSNSMEIRNQDLTSTEYNGRLLGTRYNQIYTSSSEGYQSDNSEIMIPVSSRKIFINNMASTIENNHQGVEGPIFQTHVTKEQANCTFNRGSKLDNVEYSEQFADIFTPICQLFTPNDDEDQASDDSLNAIEFEEDAGEDVKSKTTKSKTMKSLFAKKFEEAHPDEKKDNKEAANLLNISKDIKQEVNEDDIDTVRQLTVHLPFAVPPLHSILTRTSIPSKEQLEKIKEYNLEVKTGPFSKEEDRMIINNWKRFCKEHDLKVNPSVFISFPRKMKMTEKMKFLRYLAHGLDNRLLHRVHTRFKTLLQSNYLKSGRFSPQEDEKILTFINETNSKKPFKDLAGILNRTKRSVLRRYYLLTSDLDQHVSTVKWSPEMVDILLMYMKKVTKCDELNQLKHRKLTLREWQKLSKKMDVSVLKLQRAWNITIYPRLFAKQFRLNELKAIKEDIIHTLYERKEQDWRSVNWTEIAKRYKGFTPLKIYSMFRQIVSYHVPESKQKNLEECLDFLENEVLKHGKLSTHKFKKFLYKQGHIVYKQESESD